MTLNLLQTPKNEKPHPTKNNHLKSFTKLNKKKKKKKNDPPQTQPCIHTANSKGKTPATLSSSSCRAQPTKRQM